MPSTAGANYSLGIREQVIFPEIDYNSIDRIRGLQIVIVTTAPSDAEGLRLLELMGMPFVRPESTPDGGVVFDRLPFSRAKLGKRQEYSG